eukprot:Clim_evm10s88 gene=Clim_evmTU10s88
MEGRARGPGRPPGSGSRGGGAGGRGGSRKQSKAAKQQLKLEALQAERDSDFSKWRPIDDLALISAVQLLPSLADVHRTTRFSRQFTISEIQERWIVLLKDPQIASQVKKAFHTIDRETLAVTAKAYTWSDEEANCLREFAEDRDGTPPSLDQITDLMIRNADIFHVSRTPQMVHEYYLKLQRFGLLTKPQLVAGTGSTRRRRGTEPGPIVTGSGLGATGGTSNVADVAGDGAGTDLRATEVGGTAGLGSSGSRGVAGGSISVGLPLTGVVGGAPVEVSGSTGVAGGSGPSDRPVEPENDILAFEDYEAGLVAGKYDYPAPDDALRNEMRRLDRKKKRKIAKLEEIVDKWYPLDQAVREPLEMSNNTLCVLRGKNTNYYMHYKTVLLGRSGANSSVDFDLKDEGPARRISRNQCVLSLKSDCNFYLRNVGKANVYVNGRNVPKDKKVRLPPNALLEIDTLTFIFVINQLMFNRLRAVAYQ